MSGMDKPGRFPHPILPAVFLRGSLWGLAEAAFGTLLDVARGPGLPPLASIIGGRNEGLC